MINTDIDLRIGILAAKTISFRLLGDWGAAGRDREERAEIAGDKILWRGELYDRLDFVPASADASFELADVTIGIDFHWQRAETQRFEGALSIVVEGDKLRAINTINIERYLRSVISSEMSASSPIELLKAHAVISRSWAIAQIQNRDRHREEGASRPLMENGPRPLMKNDEIITWMDREDHIGFDLCADDHCQRYQGITRAANPAVAEAVEATRGEALVDSDGRIADTRFSKCCGGATELFENCWGNDCPRHYLQARLDIPGAPEAIGLDTPEGARRWIEGSPEAFCNTADEAVLSAVLNSYDQETPSFYRWSVSYTQKELAELIGRRSGIDFGRIKALEPLTRGKSGRITRLRIVGERRELIIGKELIIRRWLSESHLYSSAFVVETAGESTDGYPDAFHLRGAGWGHGVGLCQIGAAVMATRGYTYRQILSHYFPGAEIARGSRE